MTAPGVDKSWKQWDTFLALNTFDSLTDVLERLRPWWNPWETTYNSRIHVPLLHSHVCVGLVEGEEVDRTYTSKLVAARSAELVMLEFTDFRTPGADTPSQIKSPVNAYIPNNLPPSPLFDGLRLTAAPQSIPVLEAIVDAEVIEIPRFSGQEADTFARGCYNGLEKRA
jgi:hypothetical protein